jgi:YHS domain-containing protein
MGWPFGKKEKQKTSGEYMHVGDTGSAKDPVCEMMVDPKTAPAKSEYKGQTYYFCAPGCKTSFDKDPEKYLGKAVK